MTQTLKKAAKLAVMLQMKEPGSVTQAYFPKALYAQQQLDLFYKKDCLLSYLLKNKKEKINLEKDEICKNLGLDAAEYETCCQVLVREGRI